MDLKKISRTTTWGEAASDLNNNFGIIKEILESIGGEYSLAKGFFETLNDLKKAYPNPDVGDWAYVGSSFPANYYTWDGADWIESEDQTQPENIDLEGYIQSERVIDVTKILN